VGFGYKRIIDAAVKQCSTIFVPESELTEHFGHNLSCFIVTNTVSLSEKCGKIHALLSKAA